MATVEELEDEILEAEISASLQKRSHALFDEMPYTTTLLLELENWLHEEGDEKAARIVEQATLKMATHEAETS
jgi:hypothetical protein